MPRSSTKMLSCRDRAERLEPAIKQSVLNPGLSSGQLQDVGGLGEEWNTWSRFLAPLAPFIALCCIYYGKRVASMHGKDLLRALASAI